MFLVFNVLLTPCRFCWLLEFPITYDVKCGFDAVMLRARARPLDCDTMKYIAVHVNLQEIRPYPRLANALDVHLTTNQIEKDLMRTFPCNKLFNEMEAEGTHRS